MAGRFARSLALAKASWSVIRADKELLWLPVLSVLALLLLLDHLLTAIGRARRLRGRGLADAGR